MKKGDINKISNLMDGLSTINAIHKKVCGELLGAGANRDVYVLKQFPEYVIKIERNMSKGTFANAMEWRNYIDYSHGPLGKWLAPCLFINETGQVLVQQRVIHKEKKFYPKLIPAEFTDLKTANFGFIDKNFVCCDYSFFRTAVFKKKMRPARFWTNKKK